MPESDTSEAETSEAVENVPHSGVPDDLDLGGITINIWSPADTNVVSESYVSLAAEGLYLNLKDAPYSVVLDGDWTIDHMREISAEVFVDVDNDGIAGRADVLGYCINTLSNLDGFFYGSGASITSRDENRIPYIDMMTEHTAEALRDMNADYGIVPMPKLDKSQEDYITGLHNIMRDIALPSNCQKVDEVCAVLEELAFQGHQTVIPAYFEIVLKNKYARDEASSQMLDLIKQNCVTELAYVYGLYCNNLGLLHRTMIGKKLSSISSLYASAEPAAIEKLNTLIEQFTTG